MLSHQYDMAKPLTASRLLFHTSPLRLTTALTFAPTPLLMALMTKRQSMVVFTKYVLVKVCNYHIYQKCTKPKQHTLCTSDLLLTPTKTSISSHSLEDMIGCLLLNQANNSQLKIDSKNSIEKLYMYCMLI